MKSIAGSAPFAALWPLPLPALLPAAHRAAGLRVVEAHLAMVAALCSRAIADGWDSGRLAFAEDSGMPFAAEVDGLLGGGGGRAGERLVAASERVAAARARVRALLAEGVPDPVSLLKAELGLGGLAVKILLIVAAPALWPELARIYGIVSNDGGRALCDELLVWELLRGEGVTRYDISAELGARAPLVRFGAVRVLAADDRPGAFAALSVDPAILARLRGEPPGDEDGTTLVDARVPLEGLALADGVAEAVVAAVAARGEAPLRLVVRGHRGSGRRTLLAALAARAHRRLGVIDAAQLPREPRELARALRRAIERVFLSGALPCVSGLEVFPDEVHETLRALFRSVPVPIALRLPTGVDVPLDPGHAVVELPLLREAARAAVWRQGLAAAGLPVDDAGHLAGRHQVGPGVICAVIAQAARLVATSRTPLAQAIDEALAQHVETSIGKGATRIRRLATWDNLVVPDDILDAVRELIARIRHRHTVYETWGFERTVTSARGVVALFQGSPGTGKTLVAGVIARELGLDLYRVDVSRLVSKWLGETEQNLAAIFDAADAGHAIVLFDEADSLFGKRTEVRSGNERYANMQVNYLLQRLDTFEGIAILTTNFGSAIDSAFARRLAMRLTFPFPDEEARERLWRVHLPAEAPIAGPLDLADLASRFPLSGGYIRNAVLRAAFLAAQEQKPVGQGHLERAVALEYRDVGKLATDGVLE